MTVDHHERCDQGQRDWQRRELIKVERHRAQGLKPETTWDGDRLVSVRYTAPSPDGERRNPKASPWRPPRTREQGQATEDPPGQPDSEPARRVMMLSAEGGDYASVAALGSFFPDSIPPEARELFSLCTVPLDSQAQTSVVGKELLAMLQKVCHAEVTPCDPPCPAIVGVEGFTGPDGASRAQSRIPISTGAEVTISAYPAAAAGMLVTPRPLCTRKVQVAVTEGWCPLLLSAAGMALFPVTAHLHEMVVTWGPPGYSVLHPNGIVPEPVAALWGPHCTPLMWCWGLFRTALILMQPRQMSDSAVAAVQRLQQRPTPHRLDSLTECERAELSGRRRILLAASKVDVVVAWLRLPEAPATVAESIHKARILRAAVCWSGSLRALLHAYWQRERASEGETSSAAADDAFHRCLFRAIQPLATRMVGRPGAPAGQC